MTILAASLVPWSLRNYVVDGRFSPSAARTAYYVAVLNDPRIGFYGLRYWEGWNEIAQEYQRNYPDPVERDRAMMRAGLSTPFENFDWFRRALFWRTVAFYGLLHNGMFALERHCADQLGDRMGRVRVLADGAAVAVCRSR